MQHKNISNSVENMAYVPIGTYGIPWGDSEREKWLKLQVIQREYKVEVLNKLDAIKSKNTFDIEQYGSLSGSDRYPLFTVKTRNWSDDKKCVLVTGGVHGYETSGVQGALRFIESEMEKYSEDFNIMVCPCVSPWGYETINRWNRASLDPNRGFTGMNTTTEECKAVIAYIKEKQLDFDVHFDLHETTNTDETTFRPALAERDGKTDSVSDPIPDGKCLCTSWQCMHIGPCHCSVVVCEYLAHYFCCVYLMNNDIFVTYHLLCVVV